MMCMHVQFIAGATDICRALWQAGFWADFVDPSSGRPVSGILWHLLSVFRYFTLSVLFLEWRFGFGIVATALFASTKLAYISRRLM